MKPELGNSPQPPHRWGLPEELLSDPNLSRVFDLLDHPIFAFDHNRRILFANRAALEQSEKSPKEMLNQPLSRILPHLDDVRYQGNFRLNTILRKAWGEGVVIEREAVYPGADQANRPRIHRFVPVLRDWKSDSPGKVAGMILQIMDPILESHSECSETRMKKPISSAVKEAAAHYEGKPTERQQAFTELVQTTTDQINTPLSIILGNAELIRNRIGNGDPSVAESFKIIDQEIRRIADLLKRLGESQIATSEASHVEAAPGVRAKVRPPLAPAKAQAVQSILVVDDEEYMLSLLRDIIESLGFRSVIASNGKQALKQLSRQDVNLVITDINMPGMTGIELLKEVKNQQPHIPVILITGYGKERAAEAAKRHQADGFIGKPFHIEELRLCIDRLMARDSRSRRN